MRWTRGVAAIIGLAVVVAAPVARGTDDEATISGPVDMPEDAPTVPYRVGEKLRYNIYWGVLHVGTSNVEVKEIVEVDGRPCYHIVARTRSNAVLSSFYPIDDRVETFIDVYGKFSRRFVKVLNEGKYHCDEETFFDVDNGVARWKSNLNGQAKEYEIPAEPQDVVSLLYLLRGRKLKANDSYTAVVCADEKVWELEVNTRGREKMRMSRKAGGRRTAIEVEPEAKFEGVFVRKGRMWVWVSEDDDQLLLKMKTKIPVASIKMVLEEARNVGPPPDREAGYRPVSR